MKKIYLLLFICSSFSSYGQVSADSIASIPITSDYFTVDKQRNGYFVKGDELFKYSKEGALLYRYSNKGLGPITSVDVSDFLKPLLFYKDFLKIVYLDNTLSDNGRSLSLDALSLQQTELVCASHNNRIWLYDLQNMELRQVNIQGESVQRTGNLNVLLRMDIRPIDLKEYNNYLYLQTEDNGVLIFDVYGTFFKQISAVNSSSSVQPVGDWLYYKDGSKLMIHHIFTDEEQLFYESNKAFTNFTVVNDLLVLQEKEQVVIYKIRW